MPAILLHTFASYRCKKHKLMSFSRANADVFRRRGDTFCLMRRDRTEVRNVPIPTDSGAHAPGRFGPGDCPVQDHGAQEDRASGKVANARGWLATGADLPSSHALGGIFGGMHGIAQQLACYESSHNLYYVKFETENTLCLPILSSDEVKPRHSMR